MLQRYLLVACGGAMGAVLRYFVGSVAAQRFGPRFPMGTFAINISACYMIGLTLEYLDRHTGVNPAWRYVFAIGFIGAYSTFSTFEWEFFTDLTHGGFWVGMLYVVASLVLGLLAVALGASTAKSFA